MKVKPVPHSHHEGNTDLLPKLCCGAYALSPTQLELTLHRNSSTTKSKIAATQSEDYKRKNWGGGLGSKSMQETGAHPKTFKGHL